MLKREDKQAIVSEVADVAGVAQSAVIAEYRGLSVAQMTELRRQAREAGVYLRVVKNTLAKRALDGTDYADLREHLAGPLLLVFSRKEPSVGARVVRDFAKRNEALVPKVVAIQGRVMPGQELERLASLPTREEALSQLMATMQAPIQKLAATLQAPHVKLVRTLQAVRQEKDKAA